jgi:hypothetical protein
VRAHHLAQVVVAVDPLHLERVGEGGHVLEGGAQHPVGGGQFGHRGDGTVQPVQHLG